MSSLSHPDPTPYSALVLGPTGAVGVALVKELLSSAQCERVGAVVRQSDKWAGEGDDKKKAIQQTWNLTDEQVEKVRVIPVDFETLDKRAGFDTHLQDFSGYTKGFSALGSTRKKAGSAEAFHRIDHDYVLAAASIMKAGGVQHMGVVSSVGADAQSSMLYTRTKGEIEEAITHLGFPRVSIYRPGLLLTPREESRPGEWFAQKVVPSMHWLMGLFGQKGERYKAIKVEDVAQFARMTAESQPNQEYGKEVTYKAEEMKRVQDHPAPAAANEQPQELRTHVEVYENEVLRSLKL